MNWRSEITQRVSGFWRGLTTAGNRLQLLLPAPQRTEHLAEKRGAESAAIDLIAERSAIQIMPAGGQTHAKLGVGYLATQHLGLDKAHQGCLPLGLGLGVSHWSLSPDEGTPSYSMTLELDHTEHLKHDIIVNDDVRTRRMPNPLHFLKRSAARTLSVTQVARMSEEEAYDLFKRVRWPETNGAPYCPHCGTLRCYEIRTRKKFKCSACRKTFSVTSGTLFHSAKLPYWKYLCVIALFVNAAKGISALQISRDVGINYKTAFVLLHKLRQAIEGSRSNLVLDGGIEIDGAYYGGHTRPANAGKLGQKAAQKVGKREQAKLSDKMCILVMVQRGGCTIPTLTRSETTEAAMKAAAKHIKPGSTVYADEHRAYDALHAWFSTHRINHQRAFADGAISTNQAESFHSRMRRAEIGQYHRISGKYLLRYGWEAAYRSDRRRVDNGAIFNELTEIALHHPVSRDWKGYWQARAPKTPVPAPPS